jgi:hypothetical protein
MYICCALFGAIKDSVSQNARCNSEKNKPMSSKWSSPFSFPQQKPHAFPFSTISATCPTLLIRDLMT